jgi:hypothetical protein
MINGCYSIRAVRGSHAVVLQDQGTPCPADTKPLSWNQTGPQGPAGVSGLQIETCNTGQLFGFQAPGAGTLNPLCSSVPAGTGRAVRLDCPHGKAAISASWGGWDGSYGSSGQGQSPLSAGVSGGIRIAAPTADDSGYVFLEDGSWPSLLYVTCTTAS